MKPTPGDAPAHRIKLRTQAVCKIYRALPVIEDISIDVRAGEFVAIVGASGCGKTTFLRMIDGLIRPSSGSITIDGRPVVKPGDDIAFVFQQDGLLPWRKVVDNTVLGPEIQHGPMKKMQRIAHDTLKLVGLSGFDAHYPHELSGGMRQRVNIARALTFGADVLLMDEPFAALDAQTRNIMQAELLRIWQDTGKTVIFVTHQIDEAVYLSDRVLIFTARPGRLKEEVAIDLPRPRELAVKWTPQFTEYTNHIWRSIEEEVRESIGFEISQHAAVR